MLLELECLQPLALRPFSSGGRSSHFCTKLLFTISVPLGFSCSFRIPSLIILKADRRSKSRRRKRNWEGRFGSVVFAVPSSQSIFGAYSSKVDCQCPSIPLSNCVTNHMCASLTFRKIRFQCVVSYLEKIRQHAQEIQT